MATLQDVSLTAQIAALQAENARLKASQNKISLKVSGKGAISVYGFGKFPITLYRDAFVRLLDMGDQVREFIKTNDKILAVKGQTPTPELAAHIAAHAAALAKVAAAQAAKA